MRGTRRTCGVPPLVGLLNLPARPLLPGGMLQWILRYMGGRRKGEEGIPGQQ